MLKGSQWVMKSFRGRTGMFELYTDIVTPAQAQRMLGIGRTKMYSLIHKGVIPSRKIGGQYFIRKVDLIHLMTPDQKP